MRTTQLFVLPLFFIILTSAKSQNSLGVQWQRINKGIGGADSIPLNNAGREYKPTEFDITDIQLLKTQRKFFAYINSWSNNDGLFQFNSDNFEWTKVANSIFDSSFRSSSRAHYFSSQKNVYAFIEGEIFQYSSDTSTYPSGWMKISNEILNDSIVAKYNNSQSVCFKSSFQIIDDNIQVIDDTAYFFIKERSNYGQCLSFDSTLILGKFSIQSGRWVLKKLPSLPRESESKHRFALNKINGFYHLYVYFSEPYREINVDGDFTCTTSKHFSQEVIPQLIWTYTPGDTVWKDLSRGPNWCDLLNRKAVGGSSLFVSPDSNGIIINNHQGTWRWKKNVNEWTQINDRIKVINDIDLNNNIYYEGALASGSLGGGGGNVEITNSIFYETLSIENDTNHFCKDESKNVFYENLTFDSKNNLVFATLSNIDNRCTKGYKDSMVSNSHIYYGIYAFDLKKLKNTKLVLSNDDLIDAEITHPLLTYPSPTSDYLKFKGGDFNGQLVKIYSTSGQELISDKVTHGRINVSSLPSGHFIVKMKNISFKIVKQ